MQNHYEQWKNVTYLSNLNAKWIGLWSIQKPSIVINISFWKVGKNVVNDKNLGLYIAMMWIIRWVFLLKVVTINYVLAFESSIIVLSYDNIIF